MISIDQKSSIPLFKQVAEKIEELILVQQLKPEQAIPSVRELALAAVVNPNTVVKAYALLQERGLIESRKGSRFFVRAEQLMELDKRRRKALHAAASEFVSSMLKLNFDESEIMGSVKNSVSGTFSVANHPVLQGQ